MLAQQLSPLATPRVRTQFMLRLHRVRTAIESQMVVPNASGAHILQTLRQMHAQPLEESGPIIWTVACELLAPVRLQYSPAVEQEIVSFVTSLLPPLRKETEDYCRGVTTWVSRIPASSSAPNLPQEATQTLRWISSSLAQVETTLRESLMAQARQFARTLDVPGPPPPTPPPPVPRAVPPPGIEARRVFIAHGHDEAARDAVANLLYAAALEPVILHEQAGTLHTIIEKLERHSDVGFAIVLLTPDDEGRARLEGTPLAPRARQNVILELGYFIGKLGRHRVCALYRESVELPSDLSGIHYISLDSGGGWKARVRKELLDAGFTIDPKKLV